MTICLEQDVDMNKVEAEIKAANKEEVPPEAETSDVKEPEPSEAQEPKEETAETASSESEEPKDTQESTEKEESANGSV